MVKWEVVGYRGERDTLAKWRRVKVAALAIGAAASCGKREEEWRKNRSPVERSAWRMAGARTPAKVVLARAAPVRLETAGGRCVRGSFSFWPTRRTAVQAKPGRAAANSCCDAQPQGVLRGRSCCSAVRQQTIRARLGPDVSARQVCRELRTGRNPWSPAERGRQLRLQR